MSDQRPILIVTEDENLNTSLVQWIHEAGDVVECVTSGTEALRLLAEKEFRVVISDSNPPGIDGFELLAWLRTYRPNVPMIMVSASNSTATRTQALENGAFSYLEKPVDPHLLNEELRRLFRQTGFSANLDSFDLLDVIQMVTLSQKTIALLVNVGSEEQGLLGFRNGELIWSEYGTLHGEEAFFALAAQTTGTVTHQMWNQQVTPNITQPLSRLIMQALQNRQTYTSSQQLSEEEEPEEIADSLTQELEDDNPFVFFTKTTELPAFQQSAFSTTPQEQQAESLREQEEETTSGNYAPPIHKDVATGDLVDPDVSLISEEQHREPSGISPFTVYKTSGGKQGDLPLWLQDQTIQPSQTEPPPPQSLSSSGSMQVLATPILFPLSVEDLERQVHTGALEPSLLPEPQKMVKPNYSALVAALQTLGYSCVGFVAAAVVSQDGQPIAQVATEELDISHVSGYFSGILKNALGILNQSGWGSHEQSIITSTERQILIRLVGKQKNAFQVLITTREANSIESLAVMMIVEEAISAALG